MILRMANIIWRFTIAVMVLIVEARTSNTVKGGEVFCYTDTIDGNCRPAKNLKMWPPVCVSESLLSIHTPPLETVDRVDSHLENDAIQVSAVCLANA